MDNTSIGQMSLEQIPPEFRPNKYERKSPWALIIIFLVTVLFGIFYFTQIQNQSLTVAPIVVEPRPSAENITDDLEASVGLIDIPSYSDDL